MSTVINHNLPSLNAFNKLNFNNNATSKSMEKLSSGLGINRAADNAAGLAISEKMRAQIRGLDQAGKNSMDAVSLIQTAEGGLNETHSILQRMRELAVQSANGTYQNDVDREAISDEVNALKAEIDRIADATKFNGMELLNGKIGGKEILSGSSGKVLLSAAGTNPAVYGDIKVMGLAEGTKVTVMTTTGGASVGASWNNEGKELTITIMNDGTSTLQNIISSLTSANVANLQQDGFDASQFNIIFTNTETNRVFDMRKEGLGVSVVTGFGSQLASLTPVTFFSNTKEVAQQASYSIVSLSNAVADPYYGVGVTIRATEAGAAGNNLTVLFSSVGIGGAGTIAGLANVTKGNEQVTKMDGGAIIVQLDSTASYTEKELNDILKKFNAGIEIEYTGRATGSTSIAAASLTSTAAFGGTGSTTGVKLSKGTGTGQAGLTFQIGANGNDFEELGLKIKNMSTVGLGIDGDKVKVDNQVNAKAAIDTIDKAINAVATQRAGLGATQNRLESTINNLTTTSENLTAAESRIRDVDMAKEMMNYTKMNILSQAAQAMMAQANQQPQAVLQLLR